jgi:hypothetical protein
VVECSRAMKTFWISSLLVGLVAAALLILPLRVGIWLPDVLVAPEKTLAEQKLSNGYSFRVVQYWNRSDFYTTQLRVTSPNGITETNTLDGDDSKSWRLPLVINQSTRTATVTLSGNRMRSVEW